MLSAWKNRRRRGFTLVEVMIAMTVLSLALASSMVAITAGFRVMEDARMTTLASQVLQSEMETLRLKNFTEISELPVNDPTTFTIDSTLDTASFNRFTCTRTVTGTGNMREITLRVDWTTTSGLNRSRQYYTYFGKGGLSDYFYRKI
jgi:prepilin-type N-terminal cleavage/methylation domain-containing protein